MRERLKKIIEKSQHLVFFGGAGVSTESGIPDFRSEEGLYKTRNQFGYRPEEIVSHEFFFAHPDVFYRYYFAFMIHPQAKPNACHRALAKWEQEGKRVSVITQNIDGLHDMAGSGEVYELHGSIHRNNCVKCGKTYDLPYILDEKNTEKNIPYCHRCHGMIKPEVVLFGEPLDQEVIEGAVSAISQGDTLIIGGTSLAVYPAAGYVGAFRGGNVILINKEKTLGEVEADISIQGPIGEIMGSIAGI